MSERPYATPADNAACRELIRTGSRSFHTASLLLPDDVREGAYALYGFCRLSDDAVDIDGRADAVSGLRARLDAVFAGAPGVADRPLADAVRRFALPRAPLDALLEGLAWDAEGRRYETEADLEAYAARVAGSVGAMMAALMGARTPMQLARACDLGVAMQYTNIARDVGEDARNGRLYLPRTWMREAGLDPDVWLAAPRFSANLATVVERLLRRADVLYTRADAGIAQLPRAVRPAIHAARLLYAAIGDEVARRGYDSVSARAHVPARRKALLAAQAIHRAPRGVCTDAALPGTQFLVDAVMAQPTPTDRARSGGRDIVWVLELFETLERRRAPA